MGRERTAAPPRSSVPLSPPDPPLADSGRRGSSRSQPRHRSAFERLIDDDDVRAFTMMPSVPSATFVRTWIRRYEEAWGDGTRAGFAIVDEERAIAGFAAIFGLAPATAEGEIGYFVAAEARGRGIATSSVDLLTGWGVRRARPGAARAADRRPQPGLRAGRRALRLPARGRPALQVLQRGPAQRRRGLVAPAKRLSSLPSVGALRARPLSTEAIVSGLVASAIAALLIWLGPPGVDLAAHVYQRTFLLHHGFALWNNFWYAGRYSFVTYSFIYYPLAALIGIKALAVLSLGDRRGGVRARRRHGVGAERALLEPHVRRHLAGDRPLCRVPVRARRRSRRCSRSPRSSRGAASSLPLAIFLTLLASPLALLLVVLVLVGGTFGRRPRGATVVVIASAVLLELALRRIFPGEGEFPFSVADLVPGILFGVLGIAVTARVPGAKRLVGLFGVLLAAILVAFVVPSDLGSNVERLKFMAIPIAVLTASIAPKRILLVIPLVAVAGFWNISALAHTAKAAGADPGQPPFVLAARDHVSPRPSGPLLPRRGGRHDRALAGRLPARGGHPDRARLVPPERLSPERDPLRHASRCVHLSRVAPEPRRALRRHLGCADRLQRSR